RRPGRPRPGCEGEARGPRPPRPARLRGAGLLQEEFPRGTADPRPPPRGWTPRLADPALDRDRMELLLDARRRAARLGDRRRAPRIGAAALDRDELSGARDPAVEEQPRQRRREAAAGRIAPGIPDEGAPVE